MISEILLYLLAFLLLVLLEFICKPLVKTTSDELILYFQRTRTPFILSFFNLLAEIGDGFIYFTIAIICLNFCGKAKALYYLVFLWANLTL